MTTTIMSEELVTKSFQLQKLTYIGDPDNYWDYKEGKVDLPEHYKYSSAIDYSGGQGLIPIHFL